MFHDNLEEDKRAGLETVMLITHTLRTATNSDELCNYEVYFITANFSRLWKSLRKVSLCVVASQSRAQTEKSRQITVQVLLMSQYRGKCRKLKTSIGAVKKKNFDSFKKSERRFFSADTKRLWAKGNRKLMKNGAKANVRFG